jgi:hypothetical protein
MLHPGTLDQRLTGVGPDVAASLPLDYDIVGALMVPTTKGESLVALRSLGTRCRPYAVGGRTRAEILVVLFRHGIGDRR